MSTQQMQDTVHRQRLAFVVTVSGTGKPSVSPKETFVVVNDRTAAFGDVRSLGKIANLLHRPAVEVNFGDPLVVAGIRRRGSFRREDRPSRPNADRP